MSSTLKTYRVEAGNAHCRNPALRYILPPGLPAVSGARLGKIVDELASIRCKHALSPLKLSNASLSSSETHGAIILAAVALGLQRHVGCDVRLHGSAGRNQRDQNVWWVECWDARFAERAIDAAMEILGQEAATPGATVRPILDRALGEMIDLFARDGGAASTWIMVNAARKLGIPHHRTVPGYAFVNLGIGARCMRFRYSVSEHESFLNNVIQHNKALTAQILSNAGISVPRQERVTDVESAMKAAERIGYPVVVKPTQGQSQKGVEVNIRTPEVLSAAISRQGLHDTEFVVEKFFEGGNYRFMAARGKITNCYKRFMPEVIGNGRSTIRELIEDLNRDPNRGPSVRFNRSPIDIENLDRDPRSPYRDQGLTLSNVPANGERVLLSYFWLGTNGGEIKDITPEYHPSYDEIVRRVYAHIQIPICGIDILAKDITAPAMPGSYAINEINSRPALSIFHRNDPSEPVAERFLRAAIGEPEEFRVPVALMVSDNAEPEIADALRGHLGPGPVAHAGLGGYRIGNAILSTDFHADIHGTLRAMADREAEALLLERKPQNLLLDGIGLASIDILICVQSEKTPGSDGRSEACFAESLAKQAAIYLDTIPPPRKEPSQRPVRAVLWSEGTPPALTSADTDLLVSFEPTDDGRIALRNLATGRSHASRMTGTSRRAALVAVTLKALDAQSS